MEVRDHSSNLIEEVEGELDEVIVDSDIVVASIKIWGDAHNWWVCVTPYTAQEPSMHKMEYSRT
jgi:hypothetical protein